MGGGIGKCPGDGFPRQGEATTLSQLGPRAATEHWIVNRTARSHRLPGTEGIRVVNGVQFQGWLEG